MTWGNPANVTTVNLDSASDDPSLARAELLAALQELQAVIAGRNTTNGVAPLDSSGLVPNTNLPDTIISSSGNNLILQPNTGVVGVNYLINLTAKTTAQLEALTPVPNMIALCSDGTPDRQCLAVYVGDNDLISGDPLFYRIPLQNPVSTTIGSIYSLDPVTVADLNAQTAREGDVAYCSNGDAGARCLAVYDGSAWKRISLGATISTT